MAVWFGRDHYAARGTDSALLRVGRIARFCADSHAAACRPGLVGAPVDASTSSAAITDTR